MEQTLAHEQHNPDLLRVIPTHARSLVEVGCSSGALAREFKNIAPSCDYTGIEIDETYAALARRYCDRVMVLDIEAAGDNFWSEVADRDCWIFGDVLEHLRDPWSILKKVRSIISAQGSVAICIPNMQHWSIHAKLAVGDLQYEDTGLMDRTHIRWFTRSTMLQMLDGAGFTMVEGFPRIFADPQRDKFLPIIGQMAKAAGGDPKAAMVDAIPLQYVIRAVPK